MKRTDIRAGVVYAVKSSYGPPSPIVFLEDGAAGLYQREPYGKTGIRKLKEDKYTKAKRGSGWSETTRGYAAVTGGSRGAGRDVPALLAAIDPAAELARFVASESPSVDGLEFSIRYTLSDIAGPYAEAKAEYEARVQNDRAERQRIQDRDQARRDRAHGICDKFTKVGVIADAYGDFTEIHLSLDEAEKLLALLRDEKS